jgi:N-acyl-D-amino-acid deacylase
MRRTAVLTLAACCLAASVASQSAAPFDVVIRGGTIFDGTGGASFTADVGIRNGRIASVGGLSGRRADVEITARGLYVAPGFINIHSHPIADGLSRAENMLTQGVTTEILNPDGGGPLEIAQQLAAATAAGLAVNAGAYIGFNSAWSNVVGADNRKPTSAEIERMRELVLAGLENGAWGVSSGLDYKPAYFAQVEDVVRIVSVAAPWRTNFTNHDRITPESNFSSTSGITETLAIGTRARLLPVVTHMKAQGREQGTAAAILKSMAQGRYAAADAYPYLAGQSGLGALIVPAWAQEGGREAMLTRFADPATRARIVSEAERAMDARFGGPAGVYVTTINRELTDVMRETGVTGGEAIVRLLEEREMGAILRFGAEADLVAILKHPATSVACDCGATPGPASHPRYYGSFPRVLGRYVRETKALTWADAIRKMTGLPASTIGMVDRGFIAAGMAADVVVFDPATVIDRATFEKPTELSEGIRHVVVNGRVALRDGRPTGERAGRALRRTSHMPSRPMSTGVRRVAAAGTVGEAEVTLDVRQDGTERARGSFRYRDSASKATIDATEFGVLQTADRWASFTARARWMPSREERAITVIVDEGDPAAPNRTEVIVEAEDATVAAGALQGRARLAAPRRRR